MSDERERELEQHRKEAQEHLRVARARHFHIDEVEQELQRLLTRIEAMRGANYRDRSTGTLRICPRCDGEGWITD